LFPPEVIAAWQDREQQVRDTGGLISYEEDYHGPNGMSTYLSNLFPLYDEDGAIYAFSGISIDISDWKQAEEDLRTFKTLVETSPDPIGVADMQGTITYANPAFRALSGYDDALHGRTFLTLYPEETQSDVLESVQHIVEQGSWQGSLTMQCADSSQVPVHLTSFLIHDAQGQPVGMTGVFRDITEQLRAEEEREQFQQQIIEAQRLALRELSTPLIPISDNTVIMPLIGTIDSQRAQQVMEALLEGIAAHQADIAILDITGVQVVDTQVADALIRAARAAKLLGSTVILTGIQPRIAQTLVHLGVDMTNITTRSSLQAGIAYALRPR
jgi:rsbT co-antagonist protein RsbR